MTNKKKTNDKQSGEVAPCPPDNSTILTVTETITILSLLVKISDVAKFFIEKYNTWLRNRRVKKEYDKIKKDVEEGNVDNINDRLR